MADNTIDSSSTRPVVDLMHRNFWGSLAGKIDFKILGLHSSLEGMSKGTRLFEASQSTMWADKLLRRRRNQVRKDMNLGNDGRNLNRKCTEMMHGFCSLQHHLGICIHLSRV